MKPETPINPAHRGSLSSIADFVWKTWRRMSCGQLWQARIRPARFRLGHGPGCPIATNRELAVSASAGLLVPDSKLGGVKQVVQALPAHEFVMRAGIDDAAMVHDQDAVRFPDRRQPVCNDKYRPVLAE